MACCWIGQVAAHLRYTPSSAQPCLAPESGLHSHTLGALAPVPAAKTNTHFCLWNPFSAHACHSQTALDRQDLSCTCLAHNELESCFIYLYVMHFILGARAMLIFSVPLRLSDVTKITCRLKRVVNATTSTCLMWVCIKSGLAISMQ